ncbi:hypothetical protein MPNT_80045 [Candidatus Methylacidithermus pantelleriae]|uniref:Uncharacterized protein n=1 Tax=Candidatus Methylacidithermus pantelleriae TaxID=2744239 RepID=A0A8J2BSU5_9BACT|nr:hypothetical protein MPNT_80045 [Candidatus Methylacidithermus pantelleriae]
MLLLVRIPPPIPKFPPEERPPREGDLRQDRVCEESYNILFQAFCLDKAKALLAIQGIDASWKAHYYSLSYAMPQLRGNAGSGRGYAPTQRWVGDPAPAPVSSLPKPFYHL